MSSVKVRTDYADGDFTMELYEGFYTRNPGYAFYEIPQEEWDRYKTFMEEHKKWQRRLRDIDNDIWSREHPE